MKTINYSISIDCVKGRYEYDVTFPGGARTETFEAMDIRDALTGAENIISADLEAPNENFIGYHYHTGARMYRYRDAVIFCHLTPSGVEWEVQESDIYETDTVEEALADAKEYIDTYMEG